MTDGVFRLPDLGEGLTDATILQWRVDVGDRVVVDQVVVEVETAKASVEIPVPFAGTVGERHGAEGAVVTVGSPLITIIGAATGGAPAHDTHRAEERAGSGNVLIGYGTSGEPGRRRRRTASVPLRATGPGIISPRVRSEARNRGVDIDTVVPTGPGGIITEADILRRCGTREPAATGTVSPGSAVRRIPITGFRRAVSDRLCASRREIPDATTWVDADVGALLAARRTINEALRPADRISLLALLARLTVLALREFPELNATVDTARQEIVQSARVHLGIAAQTPRGLLVPVITDADTRTTIGLAQELAITTAMARSGELPPNRMTGGTFTLNNYGVFGVDGSTPIINHPEAAILGVGRIVDKPWVRGGQVVATPVAQFSLTFDHRVCDGAVAGGFLRRVADLAENPIAALGRI